MRGEVLELDEVMECLLREKICQTGLDPAESELR